MKKVALKNLIALISTLLITAVTVLGLYFGGVGGKQKEYFFKMSTIRGIAQTVDGKQRFSIYSTALLSKDYVAQYQDNSKYSSVEYFTVLLPKEAYQELSALGKDTDDSSLYAFSQEELNENVRFICFNYSGQLNEGQRICYPKQDQTLGFAGARENEMFYSEKQACITFYQYFLEGHIAVSVANQDVQYFAQAYAKITRADGTCFYDFASVDTIDRFCSANGEYS